MKMLAEILRRLLEMPADKLRRLAEHLENEEQPANARDSGSPKSAESDDS
jgi:hypothetical protein